MIILVPNIPKVMGQKPESVQKTDKKGNMLQPVLLKNMPSGDLPRSPKIQSVNAQDQQRDHSPVQIQGHGKLRKSGKGNDPGAHPGNDRA